MAYYSVALKHCPSLLLTHLTKLITPLSIYVCMYVCMYVFMAALGLAALGLCCSVRAFSSCSEQGLLFTVVLWPLIAVASLVADHGL